jgi:hypothetical protein
MYVVHLYMLYETQIAAFAVEYRSQKFHKSRPERVNF